MCDRLQRVTHILETVLETVEVIDVAHIITHLYAQWSIQDVVSEVGDPSGLHLAGGRVEKVRIQSGDRLLHRKDNRKLRLLELFVPEKEIAPKFLIPPQEIFN